MLLELLLDTLKDTWLTLPLLFSTYCLLEFVERKQSSGFDEKIFFALQKAGPLVGALVGLIPQCGFGVLAAMLFVQRNISLGTLLAVMIATSDEAIPILISQPQLLSTLGFILIAKFIFATLVGYIVDMIIRNQHIIRFEEIEEEDYEDEEMEQEQTSSACPCCYPEYPWYLSALLRTLKIYLYLFITSFVLSFLVEWAGPDTLKSILLSNTILQPLLASLIGFIPNCAATVVLSELYLSQHISLGSLFAGLVTNSGLALLVLIRYQTNKKELIQVLTILLMTAMISAALIQAFV